jgi:hypothetical protein
VSERTYTDADLRAEAARQLDDANALGILADMAIRAPWNALDPDTFNQAHSAVVRLVETAADTSAWAVALGAAGLEPHEPHAVRSATGGWEVAVQVATNPQITSAARERLLAEIRAAVDDAVCRVLGQHPTQENR